MIGFNNMSFRELPPEQSRQYYIDEQGSVIPADYVEEEIAITGGASVKRKKFPWWLLVVLGYVTYKEYTG